MLEPAHMDAFRQSGHVNPGQSTPTGGATYDPPQVEVVVTVGELEREAQYAGPAGYAIP